MPAGDPYTQICDGIVVSDDSIVLMEYKSNMFRADTKYSGSHSDLAGEIEKKLVHDKETDKKKGVWQLSDAVEMLFGPGPPVSLQGVDVGKIKHVYLYLVTLDSIGGTIGMSPLLDTFLEERLQRSAFPTINIRPLFCSDIESLETVTGFFGEASLPEILEQWFKTNPSLAVPVSAIDLGRFAWRDNSWLHAEWNTIYKSMIKILFPDKDPEAALGEAIRLSAQARRHER
jgi:hypothetical protein